MDAELQQLKDIHLPKAISSWQVAPGWIIIFVFFLGLLSYFIYVCYKRNQRKKIVRFALLKLKKLKDLMAENPDNINIAAEISTLIRRTALYYFRREEIAGLSGQAWLNFLNLSGNTTQFSEEIGSLLIEIPYRNHINSDLTPLFPLAETWLIAISKKKRWTEEK